jgi:solute carrier family 25 (peroxisomal adenine nucleotide transporter), member 17
MVDTIRFLISGIYYFWYEWSKAFLENAAIKSTGRRRPLTTAESMLAGLIAGSATVILTNPIWVVNTRQTARRDVEEKEHHISNLPPTEAAKDVAQRATGFVKLLADIVKSEGLGALWSGVIPALVLVINPIIQYTVFEQLKANLEIRRGSKSTPNDAFYLGALGKLMATGITYPYSTISSEHG